MLPVRKTLFDQLCVVLKKKSSRDVRKKKGISESKRLLTEYINVGEKEKNGSTRETLSFLKLEKRLDTLEDQNDQLLYFIDFLIEKLPQLINDILHKRNGFSNSETINNSNYNCSPEKLFNYNHGCPRPTPREVEVLQLLVKGLCAKEIANQLYISETTVITHKKNLKEKFNAKNTAELISKAHELLTRPDM